MPLAVTLHVSACRLLQYSNILVQQDRAELSTEPWEGHAGKRYFQHTKLADIIGAYPMRPGLSDSQMAREQEEREAFLDFLMGVLVSRVWSFYACFRVPNSAAMWQRSHTLILSKLSVTGYIAG